jgi:hypothetical protein
MTDRRATERTPVESGMQEPAFSFPLSAFRKRAAGGLLAGDDGAGFYGPPRYQPRPRPFPGYAPG